MKRFAKSFGVTGSPAQLEAFKEWAQSIGWKFNKRGSRNKGACCLFFSAAPLEETELKNNEFWICDSLSGEVEVFSLPSQWAEAMQAASEVVEARETFTNIYEWNHPTMKSAISNVEKAAICVVKTTTINGKTTAEIVHHY